MELAPTTRPDIHPAWKTLSLWVAKQKPNSQRAILQDLKRFFAYFQLTPGDDRSMNIILKLSIDDAESFALWLRKQPGMAPRYKASTVKLPTTFTGRTRQVGTSSTLANSTINRILAHMSKMYRTLMGRGYVNRNPFHTDCVERPDAKSGQKFPTDSIEWKDVLRMIQSIKQYEHKDFRDRVVLEFMFLCGMRRSEIVGLNLGDVHLNTEMDAGWVTLRSPKTGTDRRVDFAGFSYDISELIRFRRQSGAKSGDPLIVNLHHKGYSENPHMRLTGDGVRCILRDHLSNNDIKGNFSPHSARATFITYCRSLGLSNESIMATTGHRCVESVDGYDKRRLTPKDSASIQIAEKGKFADVLINPSSRPSRGAHSSSPHEHSPSRSRVSSLSRKRAPRIRVRLRRNRSGQGGLSQRGNSL